MPYLRPYSSNTLYKDLFLVMPYSRTFTSNNTSCKGFTSNNTSRKGFTSNNASREGLLLVIPASRAYDITAACSLLRELMSNRVYDPIS